MANSPYSENRQKSLPDFKTNPEYESLFSKLSEDAYNELKVSIRTEGQYVPIVVNSSYEVLDGHHRLRACKEQGIVPKFEIRRFANKEEEMAFVIRINLGRRHLSPLERIQKAYMLEAIERKKAKARQLAHLRRGNETPLLQNGADGEESGKVIEKCAKMADVSPNTYLKGCYIIKNGTHSQVSSVINREESIDKMYNDIRATKEVEVEKEKPSFQGQVMQVADGIKLVYGDFRAITDDEIHPDSIQLIIPGSSLGTEPENLGYLAKFAERTLKPGGFLVLKVNQSDMWDIKDTVQREAAQLEVFWPFIAKVPSIGGLSLHVDSKIQVFLLFVKGKLPRKNGQFVDFKDYTDSTGYDYHLKIREHLVSSLSMENDTVCDPTEGHGTISITSTKLKRQYIGIQIDWEQFKQDQHLLSTNVTY